MRRLLKPILIALAAILVLASLGFYGWTRVARYPAFPEAAALARSVETERGWYAFEPDGEVPGGLVFYPGGLVDPAAYAPLMQRISDRGILVVIVPMPLDLAVFGVGRADKVVEVYPDVETWAIAGHSLGGAMAAEHVKDGAGPFDGIAFLASYPAESTDLSGLPLGALSIYGTEDGVSGDVFAESLDRLPGGAVLVEIEGGNHAQFGDYGPQAGDGVATIDRAEQQQTTAVAIAEMVAGLE
jgi:pimeloyl-ACP methyl ester carboxylesterase